MKSRSDSRGGRARPSSGDIGLAQRRQDAGSPPMRGAEEERDEGIAAEEDARLQLKKKDTVVSIGLCWLAGRTEGRTGSRSRRVLIEIDPSYVDDLLERSDEDRNVSVERQAPNGSTLLPEVDGLGSTGLSTLRVTKRYPVRSPSTYQTLRTLRPSSPAIQRSDLPTAMILSAAVAKLTHIALSIRVQQSLEKRRPKGGRSSLFASVLNDPATRFERQASGSTRQAKVGEAKARKAELNSAKMEYLESARLVRLL